MTKNHEFFKNCRGNKFAVECDRISRTSQKVRRIWAGLGKRRGFQKKIDSSETNEGSKIAVECERIIKTSQKVQKIWAGLEKRWVFRKESRIFQKWLDVENLL